MGLIKARILLVVSGLLSLSRQVDPSNCTAGWAQFRDSCYRVFHQQNITYFVRAKAKCRDEDSQLASVPDKDTNSFIQGNA